MKRKSILLCFLIAISICSCTNRALYDSVQRNNIQRCQELPIPQQAACEAQYQTSFDEYSRQRSELEDETQL